MIFLEEERDNYYCSAIGESPNLFVGYDTGINHTRKNNTTIKKEKIDGWFAPW